MTDTTVLLHLDDHPHTLNLLSALLGHRRDWDALSYRPTEWGAEIDWERLANGPLSSTEIAVIHIARGCAIGERSGGLPPSVRTVIVDVVSAVNEGRRRR
jgi:hypothetical protein